jgi:hypothetical protein
VNMNYCRYPFKGKNRYFKNSKQGTSNSSANSHR